jgi:membrane-bound acyltransferase YfiQ involved in biofilm formation
MLETIEVLNFLQNFSWIIFAIAFVAFAVRVGCVYFEIKADMRKGENDGK